MSTGYYREHMTPPEHRGQTWPHRAIERGADGEQVERTVQSPFPPATVGVPAVDEPAFRDFQNWQARNRRAEHPEYYCTDCGIRYASVVCSGPEGCGSARVAYPDEMRELYHCLSCRRRFRADRLCGPCIGDRQAAQQQATAARDQFGALAS